MTVLRSAPVRTLLSHLTALAAAALATVVTAAFRDFFEQNLFLLFLVAVLGSALAGGWRVGLTATAGAVAGMALFLYEPIGQLAIAGPTNVVRVLVFAFMAALVSLLSDALVSARRRAEARERSLRESEESYRGLFDNTSEPLYILDRSGCMIDANDAGARLFGVSRAELRGRTPADFTAPEEQGRFEAELPRIEAAFRGESQRFEWLAQAADGRRVPLDISLSRSRYFGRDVVMAVAHDLTAHRQLEEQLRQSQKMEAVGRLAGGVAHDFNNVLTTIRGHVGLVTEGDVPLDDQIAGSLTEIDRAAELASTLTGQLLAFSRKQVAAPRAILLNDALRRVEALLRRLITEDIRLDTRLDPRVGAVRMDPGQLEQVVLNLVVNARDAVDAGGRIVLATELTPDGAMISVTDDGIGMDERLRARIFEPFFTTKGIGKGTGLGLSTVYGIVEQNGGTISVASRPGAGSRFEIRLPTVEPPAPGEDDRPPVESAATNPSATILVVEDEAPVRSLMEKILRRRGYHVLTADDAPQPSTCGMAWGSASTCCSPT